MDKPIRRTLRYLLAAMLIGFVALFALLSLINEQIMVKELPKAEKGQLDLSQWDDERDIRTLNGEWRFYWQNLSPEVQTQAVYAEVPNSWDHYGFIGRPSKGFATYTLSVRGLKPNRIYALKTLDQVSAFELYGNGVLLAENGVVGESREKTVETWRPVKTEFMSDASGQVDFVMKIANFEYSRGGFWNNLLIGQPALVHHYAMSRVLSDMFLFTGLFVMAAFFFGMHFLYPQDKDTLIFSLFCLMASLQIGLTGERVLYYYASQLSWDILVRIEYWVGYMLLPLFGLYMSKRFPKDAPKQLEYLFVFAGIALTLLCWGMPIYEMAQSLPYYKYLCLASGPYFFWLMARIIHNGRAGAVWMLLALMTMVLTVIKDTFYMSQYSALPYGTFVFLIAFALLTITKYVGVQKTNVLLESRVMRDALTGVYNRSYLEAFQSFDITTPYFVIFMDLDRFKQINDQYGHDTGDQVLVEITRRLRRLCQTADVICRYGGDEFVLLIMDDGYVEIQTFISQLKAIIEAPVRIKDIEVMVGASVGLSHFPTEGYTLSDLIRQSDLAMYRDKLNEKKEQ